VLAVALREAERQGTRLGHVHGALLPVVAGAGDLDGVDRHLDALEAWLGRTHEVHPDLAENADRAAVLLAEHAPDRARRVRAVAREQRSILRREATP
jgi:hypothetical protein